MKRNSNLFLFILVLLYISCFVSILMLLYDKFLQIKLIFLLTAMSFLAFSMILKTSDKVYWLTSFDYDDYKNMSLEERSKISSDYARVIAFSNSIFCVYQLVSIYFKLNIFLDGIIFFVCLIFMCFLNSEKISLKK